ncbi:MAG: hypothetical protein LBN11_06945 [Tannerella sp.]|nr:hypothetical protein [Tannerella sp.]
MAVYSQPTHFRSEWQVNASLNSNAEWEVEPEYVLMFNTCLGVCAGFGMRSEFDIDYNPVSEKTRPLGWYISTDNWRVRKLLIRPAMKIRFPILKEAQKPVLWFNMEPGLLFVPFPNETLTVTYSHSDLFSPGRYKKIHNHKGDILYGQINNSISLDLDIFQLSLGYSISNYDLYGGRRNIVVDGASINSLIPKRHLTHSIFVSISSDFMTLKSLYK